MKNRIGTVCMILGTVLVLAALSLFCRNRLEAKRAAAAADELLSRVMEYLETAEPEKALEDPDAAEEEKMEAVMIDGYSCMGCLSIPALGLSLPVLSEWDYDRLKVAPCRYAGSAKSGDFVIAAHNYERHFGRLSELTAGDEVFFTDMNGSLYAYEVVAAEVLQPDAVDTMTAGDYALTLFTCTYGGKSRVTLRCAAAGGIIIRRSESFMPPAGLRPFRTDQRGGIL